MTPLMSLGIHANTIYARFEKVQSLSGLDPLSFRGLTELLLAIEVAREPAGATPQRNAQR